jgi:hypothetical protein
MTKRAGDSRGSSRFLGLRSRPEVRIPAPEGVLPLLVEYAGSYLQEEMRSTLAPSHLLFLHHSLAHYLIDRRLDETGSDPFPVAIALPVVRYEPNFLSSLANLPRNRRLAAFFRATPPPRQAVGRTTEVNRAEPAEN